MTKFTCSNCGTAVNVTCAAHGADMKPQGIAVACVKCGAKIKNPECCGMPMKA
jgi:DNA-directed RNA polymerase subunit RPC12/RpoP